MPTYISMVSMAGSEPVEPGSVAAPLAGRIGEAFVSSIATTLHLGSSEMQRAVIAQRGLGMPRE